MALHEHRPDPVQKQKSEKSICREQGGGTPDRAAEALAAQRGRSGARKP